MKTEDEYYQDIEPIIQNGWYTAAIHALEQLLQVKPNFARGYYELGTLYYKHDDREKVLECYKKCHELDPQNIGYLKSLADFYHVELEQIEPALGFYKKIIDAGTSDAEILFIAANLCVALHNFEDAMKYYQKVLEIEPWHSEAFEYLEKIKRHQDSDAQALSPEELYQKSQEAGATDNLGTAVSILNKLIGRYPDHAVAHNDLGVYYQRLGNLEKAFQHLRHAVQIEPNNSTFEKNLADFYYVVKGDVGEALRIYLNVLKRNPDDVEVLTAAGHISKSVNRLQNAEMFFNRVLELEPWNSEASDYLAKLRDDRGSKAATGL